MTDSEFRAAIKGSKMKLSSIEAVRRVVVDGQRPADVARQLGISRQALHQRILGVIDGGGARRHKAAANQAVLMEGQFAGREPCVLCTESRFNLCRYGLLACQAFVQFVQSGKTHDPAGCTPTAARWDELFPETEVAIIRTEIRERKQQEKAVPQVAEDRLKAVLAKHRQRLEEIDARKAA